MPGVNSSTDEEGVYGGGTKGLEEVEQDNQINQDEIKDSWEDESIIGCEKEKESGESEGENEKRDVKHDWSDDRADTIIINESMEKNDKEYEPTTTDSEESVLLTKKKRPGNKN